MKAKEIKHIPAEKFKLLQRDEKIHDLKLDTKPIGYFMDAWLRFRKNKGSVVAACVLLVLFLFAILIPVFSKYDINYKDGFYSYTLPKSEFLSKFGILDGCAGYKYNQQSYDYYCAIPGAVAEVKMEFEELGANKQPVKFYDVVIDSYKKVGYVYKSLSEKEYKDLLNYEEETGIQVMYPMIDLKKMKSKGFEKDANYWFEHTSKGSAVYDENGDYKNIYLKSEDSPKGDGYAYHVSKMGGAQYQVRVLYNEYYKYINGFYPAFLFGTDQYGQDILVRLASGARLSFLLGISVAFINIAIGVIIGSVEGYYGGTLDLVIERIKEILGGIPFIVSVALFQLYLARTLGPVATLLFAFILTGWIGPANRVRTQFYRYKGQEYVLAARTLGAKDGRLIFRHILPNALGTIVTSTILIIPNVIFTESILSYLGIVDLQTSALTSVGTLLANGKTALSTYPHAIFYPAIYISLLMISFNLFGNGLRDALNPSLRGSEE